MKGFKWNSAGKRLFGRAAMFCRKHVLPIYLFTLLPLFASCSMIDEDQSDCGVQAKIDYEMRLVTNMSTEIETQLTTQMDLEMAKALREYLSGIFSDYAHDVDLSFYDTVDDSVRLKHDSHIMDANEASYTLNLPMRQYMHLAVANIVDNDLVSLEKDEYCHPSMLQQVARDTISSHATGLFTARQPMEVLEGVDQNFKVRLYMANCAACLIIDPRNHNTDGIKVFATGFATGFNICDSAFVFPKQSPIVTTTMLKPEGGSSERGYCCVTFPSRMPSEPTGSPTRTVIETEEPFIGDSDRETLWQFRVYVPHSSSEDTRSDETYTESILNINNAQEAGELTIIKGYIGENGEFVTTASEVGVSVTLDWKPGGEYHPHI